MSVLNDISHAAEQTNKRHPVSCPTGLDLLVSHRGHPADTVRRNRGLGKTEKVFQPLRKAQSPSMTMTNAVSYLVTQLPAPHRPEV